MIPLDSLTRPAPLFDDPLERLLACHGKLRCEHAELTEQWQSLRPRLERATQDEDGAAGFGDG